MATRRFYMTLSNGLWTDLTVDAMEVTFMLLVVDRFEQDMAVIEYGERTFNIPRVLLPTDCKEGDVLKFGIEIDQEATDDRKSRVGKLLEGLWEE